MSTSSDSDGSLLQNSVYVGITIQNILYGVELALYFKTISILLGSVGGVRKKSDLFYALFSSMMVFLITVWVATSAIFGEKMWLLDSNFPGGPDAYFKANISVWYLDWGTTSIIILQLMTDGLMIYRCRILWDSCRAIVIPVFLWVSTLILGVVVDWRSSSPGGDFFTGLTSQLVLAYYTISVLLNTVLTCMICYRILRHGRRVQENLGREYASLYFSIATLVIESVLPYTLSGIAFLVSLGVESPTSGAFISVYVLMMCISPQMLIHRVLAGRAWNNNATVRPNSAINFSPYSMSAPQPTDGTGMRVHLQRLSLTDGHDKAVISQV